MNDRKRLDFAPRFCQDVSIGFQSFLRLSAAGGRVLVRCKSIGPALAIVGYYPHTTAFSQPLRRASLLISSLDSSIHHFKLRTNWDSDRWWTTTVLGTRNRSDTLPARPESRRDRPKLTETSWQNRGRDSGHSIFNFLYRPSGH